MNNYIEHWFSLPHRLCSPVNKLRLSPKFMFYKPSFEILLKTQNYELRTAKSKDELFKIFSMRKEIFLPGSIDDLDIDSFDHQCDHLIITCQKTKNIVGTYRLLLSDFTDNFYSATEFDIDNFLAEPSGKIELGRACIQPHHRNGHVIDLLWRGIIEYVKLTGANYLFGCSSVHTTDSQVINSISQYFEQEDAFSKNYKIKPKEKYRKFSDDSFSSAEINAKAHIPSLLRSYISAGAKICGEPAFDKEFQCYDYFTILDLNDFASSYRRRYFR